MMAEQHSLGQVIRRRRLDLDWSQEELAARLSIASDIVRQPEISRLELGKVTLPRRPRLERISAVLGLPLGELLARSGWSGADAALTADASLTTRVPAPTPTAARAVVEPLFVPTVAPSHAAEVSGFVIQSERLRAALSRSRELRAQSEDLCRRASWAITLIEPVRRDR